MFQVTLETIKYWTYFMPISRRLTPQHPFPFKKIGSQPGSSLACVQTSSMQDKLFRRASSVLGMPLETVQEVGERRMVAKLSSLLENDAV